MGPGGASKAVSGDGRTSALTHRSIPIVADGRFDVCDDAHWAFVMKEDQRPRPSLRDRTGHPPQINCDEKSPRSGAVRTPTHSQTTRMCRAPGLHSANQRALRRRLREISLAVEAI